MYELCIVSDRDHDVEVVLMANDAGTWIDKSLLMGRGVIFFCYL